LNGKLGEGFFSQLFDGQHLPAKQHTLSEKKTLVAKRFPSLCFSLTNQFPQILHVSPTSSPRKLSRTNLSQAGCPQPKVQIKINSVKVLEKVSGLKIATEMLCTKGHQHL